MKLLLPLFWAVCACAQSGIDVPSIGAIVDASGALRPVQGVAGNFVVGPEVLSGVLSAACSEQWCLAKTNSAIVSAAGATDAPSGPVIFGLGDHDVLMFFPDSGTFARWHDNTLDPLDWNVEGEILSIRARSNETDIAVRRDGRVWIVHPDGSVVDWIADTSGPVLLLREGVLFATSDQIVFRHRDGSELRFELSGAQNITSLGSHYAAIRTSDAAYALRVEFGRERLFLLPVFLLPGSTP